MSILFISDLHLSPANPELLSLVNEFLNQQHNKYNAIYLLGDIFNTWLGDDIVPDEYQVFVKTLSDLSKQDTELFLMVGNRDFMMGKHFAKQCGAKLISDPTIIQLDNHKAIVMHGDTLCTDDKSYQRFRLWSRNKLLQWLFLLLPVKFRQNISDKIKQKSREQKQYKSAMIMDVNKAEVEKVMQQYNCQLLIHGHTHRPDIHEQVNGHRIVLGDWQNEISFVEYVDHTLNVHDQRIGIKTLKLD
jgi:UDP-2,3-diacylglucosamine hydrolase